MALTTIVEVNILCKVTEALDKVTLKKGDKCTDWVIKVLFVVTLIETQQKVKQSSWWTDCGRCYMLDFIYSDLDIGTAAG